MTDRATDDGGEPDLIVHLREKLRKNPDSDLVTTVVGRSCSGLGVKPRILMHRENGEKVYGLNSRQVHEILARWDRQVLKKIMEREED